MVSHTCSSVVRSGVFLQARAVCITAVLYVKVHSNDITFRFDLECGLAGGPCVCFVGAKDRAYRFWNVGVSLWASLSAYYGRAVF